MESSFIDEAKSDGGVEFSPDSQDVAENREEVGGDVDNSCLSSDDEDDTTAPTFVDHFSLGVSSSTVRFRNARFILYNGGEDQFVLEDRRADDKEIPQDHINMSEKSSKKKKGRHIITVRRVETGSFGLRLLRATYTLASLLVLGFLFVFCFQIILFLFLNLAPDPNLSTADIIGAVLSIPIFLYGFGSIMAMGGTFVEDTWSGMHLFGSMLHCSSTFLEWITFILFLGIPGLTLAVTLLSGKDDWWEVTAGTSVCCVFFLMVVFALTVVCCEVTACFRLIRLYKDPNDSQYSHGPWWRQWLKISREAILLTQIICYSGERRERYLVNGDEEPPYSAIKDKEPFQEKVGFYSALTQLSCCSSKLRMVDKLDPPVRSYAMEEIKDVIPFVTRQNWSLERSWCRDPNARRIFVKTGHGALRSSQVDSSVACTVAGAVLIVLIIAGLLSWYSFSTLAVILIPVIVVCCCLLPIVMSSLRLYNEFHAMNRQGTSEGTGLADEEVGKSKDHCTMSVWENVRTTQPRPWFCWSMFTLEVSFLFLWPLISLYASGNWKVGTIFLFLGGISGIRLYFNAGAVLSEVGSLDHAKVTSGPASLRADGSSAGGAALRKRSILHRQETDAEKMLRKKARLSEIVGRISYGRKTYRWMWLFAVCVLVIFLMIYAAYTEESFDYKEKGTTLAPDFYYPPQSGAQYPTCHLTKGFTLPGQNSTALMDFSFLAATAFAGFEEATSLLDTWFGSDKVVDEAEFVRQYRVETDTLGGISYKLYSFPDYPGYGVVGIRGSETMADWVVDVQMWSAAALAQLVRAFIPLGWIWTPILDELVYIVNSIESANLKKVAYYKRTTNFINDLISGAYGDGQYHTLRVTGASLGGGLSIITGAQTGAYTVAISGLNAMLSRRTFDPPITREQLDTRVFNVIPDRDPIAKVDDRAQLFQETQCRAPMNSLMGCHSMWRSVCELAYQCGSEGRPILCWCVTKYGYPEPTPAEGNTVAWKAVCASDYEDDL